MIKNSLNIINKLHNLNKKSSSDEELPDGWEKRVDSVGRTYYLDHTTRSTFWELPYSLPCGWHMCRHPSGCVYYVHYLTGTISWQRPCETDYVRSYNLF